MARISAVVSVTEKNPALRAQVEKSATGPKKGNRQSIVEVTLSRKPAQSSHFLVETVFLVSSICIGLQSQNRPRISKGGSL
jgi:hypothetical protein